MVQADGRPDRSSGSGINVPEGRSSLKESSEGGPNSRDKTSGPLGTPPPAPKFELGDAEALKNFCLNSSGLPERFELSRFEVEIASVDVCKGAYRRNVFLFSVSLLLFLYSFHLNLIASSFLKVNTEERIEVYKHVKNVALLPCIVSIGLFLYLSSKSDYVIDEVLIFSNFEDSGALFEIFLYFVPVSAYLDMMLLISGIVLSFAAAWKMNMALPKSLLAENISIKFFAFASPILSIVASCMTIYKGVSLT